MIDKLKTVTLTCVILALIILGGYLGVSYELWLWRNPKGNRTTFWTEMPAPLRFERLEKYQ